MQRPCRFPLSAIAALAIGLIAGCAPQMAQSKPFKDCASCPPMRVVPGLNLAAGESEVTRAEFDTFVRAADYHLGVNCTTLEGGAWAERAVRDYRNPGFSQTDADPAVCLTWYDAVAYLGWLNGSQGVSGYRLPTAAEWRELAEHGDRAGLRNLESGAAEWTSDCERIASHPLGACVLRERLGRHWANGAGGPLPVVPPTARDAATGFRIVKDLPKAESRP